MRQPSRSHQTLQCGRLLRPIAPSQRVTKTHTPEPVPVGWSVRCDRTDAGMDFVLYSPPVTGFVQTALGVTFAESVAPALVPWEREIQIVRYEDAAMLGDTLWPRSRVRVRRMRPRITRTARGLLLRV